MRQILFVGAPFGPFFKELAGALEDKGCQVWRICFEGGDFVETPRRNRVLFTGKDDVWPDFVGRFLMTRRIDGVVTFNDTLPRNRVALAQASRLSIQRYVLENGYLRPFWITFERDGVNGHSKLPRELQFYLSAQSAGLDPVEFRSRLRPHVLSAIRHFVAAAALSPVLPFNPEYYGDSVWMQAAGYIREWFWRIFHDEADKVQRIQSLAREGRRIFLCLLQKPGDSQLIVHSGYGGNIRFVGEALRSFALEAPADAVLIIKQHPLDYGVEKCPAAVENLVAELGLDGRVHYLRKTSIDIVMPLASAVLTVNSTAGLAAVAEGRPVICLGKAFYDIPGLTFAGSLREFWSGAVAPSPDAVRGFLAYLKATSQFNGGFHTPEARALLIPKLADSLLNDSLVHHAAYESAPAEKDEIASSRSHGRPAWAAR